MCFGDLAYYFLEILDTCNYVVLLSCKGNDDSSNDIPGAYIGIVVGVSIIMIIILAIMTIYCFYALRKGTM